MNARAFSEREAGPVVTEYACIGCGALVEGAALCDDCCARFRRIGEAEWPDVSQDDRTWFDGVDASLAGGAA